MVEKKRIQENDLKEHIYLSLILFDIIVNFMKLWIYNYIILVLLYIYYHYLHSCKEALPPDFPIHLHIYLSICISTRRLSHLIFLSLCILSYHLHSCKEAQPPDYPTPCIITYIFAYILSC